MITPSPTANAQDVTAEIEQESSVDKVLRMMLRRRRRDEAADRGTWLGLGDIKQMVGGDRDANRGDLISLVVRGDVEVSVCANGTYWRAQMDDKVLLAKVEPVDGRYILQREVCEDSRTFWFDAETYTNKARAQAALKYERWVAESRAREYDTPPRRIQRLRILAEVQS